MPTSSVYDTRAGFVREELRLGNSSRTGWTTQPLRPNANALGAALTRILYEPLTSAKRKKRYGLNEQ
jgi:hypothetical protein